MKLIAMLVMTVVVMVFGCSSEIETEPENYPEVAEMGKKPDGGSGGTCPQSYSCAYPSEAGNWWFYSATNTCSGQINCRWQIPGTGTFTTTTITYPLECGHCRPNGNTTGSEYCWTGYSAQNWLCSAQ